MRKVDSLEFVLYEGTKKERTISMPRHTARTFKEASKLKTLIDDHLRQSTLTLEVLDDCIKTVCSWYEDVTYDDIMDGLDSQQVFNFIYDSCDYIMDGVAGYYEDLKKLVLSPEKTAPATEQKK